ncbi:MAG: mannose-6-phosphate isomerase [Flavobacteriales bacterium]|nr:mannose-6-phosphate isomerase [Flavobacteriales bacterium]
MKTKLYPLIFNTIYKDKIWGGNKIHSVLGKNYDLPNCGETWELSAVKGNVSVVSSGELKGKDLQSLINEYKEDLVGKSIFEKYGTTFPLLVKYISADDDLSIQVHPDDELALKRHNSLGKTEMWYIMDADHGSSLISGFSKKTTKEEYLKYFNSGHLMDLLHKEPVKNGDCFFLHTGRVHSIGRGILLAEIQQSSDITYRIYDFDRVEASTGQPRELHVEQALDAMDFSASGNPKTEYTAVEGASSPMVHCQYFNTDIISASQKVSMDYSSVDSFVIYTCVHGAYTLKTEEFSMDVKMGQCVLIPACINSVEIVPNGHVKILQSIAF